MPLDPWTEVKWSEARQVAQAMGLGEEQWPAAGTEPQAWYSAVLQAGELEKAVSIIGHALPRYEGIVWAAQVLDAQSRHQSLPPKDQQALDRVLRWLEDPNDEYRRDAFEAGQRAREKSAEKMLGIAVFFSGGSMAPVDLPPVPAPPELSGRFAGIAVLLAAARSDNRDLALREALAAGERIASTGAAGGVAAQ